MGLFSRDREDTRSALEVARDPARGDGAITRMVQTLLDVGLDGKGPLRSATHVARIARRKASSDEAAVARVARSHLATGGAGGFLTGIGGFVTMPIALPVNVAEFYIQATRMVGAIATLRGYDVRHPQVRTAVLLTLVGSHADEVLAKAGITTGGGRLASMATRRLPPAALLILNKAIGFRLARGVGEKAFARLGRGVPLVGGVVGGGIDGWMMKKIADHAMIQFPPVPQG